MKLQLALDIVDLQGAKNILDEVGDAIDIVEVGTPFVIKEGLKAVEEIKKKFPHLIVLADLKIMDAGEHEAKIAFEAGADIVTVLGVSDDATISGAVNAAKIHCKYVMADMIGVKELEQRAIEIDKMGVDYICVHTATDVQSTGKNPLEELQRVKHVLKNARIAVAGGVNLENIESIVRERPDVVVVGGGITGKPDKKKTALALKEAMNKRQEEFNMGVSGISIEAVKELEKTLLLVEAGPGEKLVKMITEARRIFVAGAGRSGLMMKAFAMRLMHMGLDAYVVGEVVTPSIQKDDLLIIGSGSGETGSLAVMSKKAKSIGANLALVTIFPESTIGKSADIIVKIPAPTPKASQNSGRTSIQPMGNLFEQSLLLLMDSVAISLMNKLGKDSAEMFTRHANLE